MPQPLADLTGRTCLVTGASSGIGKAAARELARLGADLVLVCRDRGRGEAALTEIRKAAGNERSELLLADLSSQAQIRQLAKDYLASGRPLHVLLNNAGVIMQQRSETVDGIEATFAVNHLGYFLLTNLLLERLKQSAPARIVNVASDAHAYSGGAMPFDDLEGRKRYGPMRNYGISKLANILFTRELARRLEGTGVTANSLHPGFVASGFARNNGRVASFLMSLASPFARSPEKGAETAVYLCASREVEDVSGGYFYDCKPKWPKSYAQSDADAKRLWEVSEAMTGLRASPA
jgi:NAD(P)-dependent dehydrogenase (short-subunit alcohol dehydrogenase family)